MTLDEDDDRFCAAPSTIPGAGPGSPCDHYTGFADEYKLRAGEELCFAYSDYARERFGIG